MNETRKSDDEQLEIFSLLPESVIHHVLSTLLFEDIVRCSVLSKMWNQTCSNYPNIDLIFKKDTHVLHPPLDHVKRILDQCFLQKACIQRLVLIFCARNMSDDTDMDRWLGAAIERNVSELVVRYEVKEIFIPNSNLYSVPEKVVVSDSLKVLDLMGCNFEDSFTCIELPHLQVFKIYRCRFLGENLLNKILHGCPELGYLDIYSCVGVSLLSVSRKPRFKKIIINCDTEDLKRIEIFAPSLETFKCNLLSPCSIDLASCSSLKHMSLFGAVLSVDYVDIHCVLSKLLNIESLNLINCRAVGKVRISSSCLKTLEIWSSISPGIEIDIPNLLRLDFTNLDACKWYNSFSSWNVPKVKEIHMIFSYISFKTACRAGLKGFLMKLCNSYEQLQLLIVCRGGQNLILHEKLHAISFSSVNKCLRDAKPGCVAISSRRDPSLLTERLGYGADNVRLSLIFSSRQRIELLYKQLKNNVFLQKQFSVFELVSTEDIEHEMNSGWKSFIKTHSTGYETATIILRQNIVLMTYPLLAAYLPVSSSL